MNWEVRTMRSVTSCFNSTLYRKNLSRFWPIWALYSVIWLFALPLNLLTTIQRGQNWALEDLTHSLDYFSRVSVGYSLNLGTVLAVIFGLLAAMAVFSYLDASRSACMMHALPLRREALFLTQYLAGLSFLLLPQLAVFALTAATEAALGCLALWPLVQWLLAQGGLCLFFYSFAVFCAMFTGHLAALPVFYGVLNLLAFLMTSLVEAVCDLFLYGFRSFPSPVWELVDHLSPPVILSNAVSIVSRDDAFVLYQPGLVAVYAACRRVDVYDALIQGAGEGLGTLARIIPSLVGLMTAVYMLRASGALDLAAQALAPLLDRVGVPAELLPLMLVRPISRSAALGVGAELITSSGPDSYVGRVAAVMLGSTETTFYTIAVYFGAAGIVKTRYAVPAALCADLAGFMAAAWAVRVIFY